MPFDLNEIKKRFQKYGTINTNDDIYEEVDDIIGCEDKKELMDDFFLSLKKYKEIAPNLKEAKIMPNFTMLLYGPPGTGKTSLTKAMAKRYDIFVGIVEADRLVSPLLGDTLKNIRGVFDLAMDIAKENGVFILFFDEIDSITAERANAHEVGEIKRAVISFLQIIDKIANEAIPLAIFGATNHENQLDSAVWRRFTYHLKFDFPNFIVRKNIIESFLKRIERATVGLDPLLTDSLTKEFDALMRLYNEKKSKLGRDLKEDEFTELYIKIEKEGKAGLLYYTQGYTGADLMRGMRVALLKAIQKNLLLFDDYLRALRLVGGTKTHLLEAEKLIQTNSSTSSKTNPQDSLSTTPKKGKLSKDSDKLDIDI